MDVIVDRHDPFETEPPTMKYPGTLLTAVSDRAQAQVQIRIGTLIIFKDHEISRLCIALEGRAGVP